MAQAEIEHLREEILNLRHDVALILDILREEELTDEAKAAVEEARRTPRSQYVKLETLRKRLGV